MSKLEDDVMRARRMEFVGTRKRPIHTPVDGRLLPPKKNEERARRDAFEARRKMLITRSLPLDEPDVQALAEAGATLEGELIKTLSGSLKRNKIVTRRYENAFSFLVGARDFGAENKKFSFPQGADLIKQGLHEVTIASPDLRVTLKRLPANGDVPRRWQLISVMMPTSERSGTTTVRASRNRATHTLRH